MRIAELANHQNVERKLHFLKREVFLFECVLFSLVISLLQILRLLIVAIDIATALKKMNKDVFVFNTRFAGLFLKQNRISKKHQRNKTLH